jgi:hypothetical protein
MDLQTTNLWLAVIAITGFVQMAMTLAVAYYVTTLVRRAQRAIDVAVADTRPLVRQVSAALDDVSDLVERTRRAEASITTMVDRVDDRRSRQDRGADEGLAGRGHRARPAGNGRRPPPAAAAQVQ